MFLTIKKGTSEVLCLEAAEATLAIVYASIKEEYKDLELEIVFNKPETKVFYNIISFIRELDGIASSDSKINQEDSNLADVTLEIENAPIEQVKIESIETVELNQEPIIKETSVSLEIEMPQTSTIELDDDTEELILSDDEIEEPINFEEDTTNNEESISIEETKDEDVKQEVNKEVNLVEEVETPKVPNTPGDRMMESLKEQQKNEGLLELEGDKVNTLAYKEHLINYMKLGFACSLLRKKAKESNDTSEQSRLFNFCDSIEKRTDEYEMKFREIGLTTGQVHTFRMEVLRDIRKYQDDSIKQIYDYINKLYSLSESLIGSLK